MPILEWPVDPAKHPITHGFWLDETNNPSYRNFYTVFDGHHPGVDFSLPEGTPLRAAIPGVVVRKEFHPGMGNTLAIRNGNIYVLYAHLTSFCVDLGQKIRAKQLVAYSGNTGTATTTPHLHFELRDLTKSTLKDSVFEPIFGQKPKNYVPEFNYLINNTNTEKTFESLALRYFGLASYASAIRHHNPSLQKFDLNTTLPQGASIIIPNYQK